MSRDWKEQSRYCGKRMEDIDEAMDHANNCTELKPCPFCGGESNVREWMHPSFRMYFVKCKGCAAEGPWGKNRATAVNLWNMRAHVG